MTVTIWPHRAGYSMNMPDRCHAIRGPYCQCWDNTADGLFGTYPHSIIISMLMMIMIKYRKKNAVDTMEGGITCLFIRTGNAALGWEEVLAFIVDTLARMTIRIHSDRRKCRL